MTSATARAHPNLALVKYWGKAPGLSNVPSTPSLSMTLGGLSTTTNVKASTADEFVLNGERVRDDKLHRWLNHVRKLHDVPPLHIESSSDFPANCGLASSAAGYAALTTAIDEAFDLDLDLDALCDLSRMGSVSSARSFHGGFVSLTPSEDLCTARQLYSPDYWDLTVIVAVTSTQPKAISSSEGMARAVETSEIYEEWCELTLENYSHCLIALKARDFELLTDVAESSCEKMHALMYSSVPPVIYWTKASLEARGKVVFLRSTGVPVFFTSDAGPQIKAICPTEYAGVVKDSLEKTDGVVFTLMSGLGSGARIVENN